MPEIVMATRGSKLALTQSGWVARRIEQAHPGVTVRLQVVQTAGDQRQDVALPAIGGKGAFTKEVQDALLSGAAQVAVHSLKDLPTLEVPGLRVWAHPPREDCRDAWIGRRGLGFEALASGSVVATGALRREAQLRARIPGVQVEPIRGNVDTRLAKFASGEMDGLLLAAAGLRRLGLTEHVTEFLDPVRFLPAPGQGILAVEGRDDVSTAALLQPLDDPTTRAQAEAERAFLETLEAGCHVPVAAYAVITDGQLHLDGLLAATDGSQVVRGQEQRRVSEARAAGIALAQRLLRGGGEAVRAAWGTESV